MKSIFLGANGLERQFSHHRMMLTNKILVRKGGGGGRKNLNQQIFKS